MFLRPLYAVKGSPATFATLVFFLSVVSPSPARADLATSIAPFAGTYSETFESFPVQVFLPNPNLLVFGGQATMTISPPVNGGSQAIAIYNPPANSFGFLPVDSTVYAVTQGAGAGVSITFNTPSYQFGGYFGEGSISPPIIVNFLDNGAIVASGSFTPSGGPSLTWAGFQTSSLFTTVDITPDPNALLVMDGLQVTSAVTSVPEPDTATLATATLAIGLLSGLLLRRRSSRIQS